MMLFFYKSKAFLTILLLIIIQSVICAQNDKILIVNHDKVSSSSEVYNLLKDELLQYGVLDQQKIEIKESYKERKDWYRLTSEQKKTECKLNNIGSVIEIRERKSNTKLITYATVIKWNYESPVVNPNKIAYNWQDGSDLTNYYIEKTAYFAQYGKEKKDVVIVRFEYKPNNIDSWQIRNAVAKLHNYLTTTIPQINKNLEKKYVFKKEEKLDEGNTHIYITGEASPISNSNFNLQLTLVNNIEGITEGADCQFHYEIGKLTELKVEVATKILQVAKDKGILEF